MPSGLIQDGRGVHLHCHLWNAFAAVAKHVCGTGPTPHTQVRVWCAGAPSRVSLSELKSSRYTCCCANTLHSLVDARLQGLYLGQGQTRPWERNHELFLALAASLVAECNTTHTHKERERERGRERVRERERGIKLIFILDWMWRFMEMCRKLARS